MSRNYPSTSNSAKLRRMTFEEYGAACVRCKQVPLDGERGLEVHHRTYTRLSKELPTDVVPLCKPCHGIVHAHQQAGTLSEQDQIYFAEDFAESLARYQTAAAVYQRFNITFRLSDGSLKTVVESYTSRDEALFQAEHQRAYYNYLSVESVEEA